MPFTTVDDVTTAGGHRLTLYSQAAGEFFIYIDGQELMSSRTHGSERALAELALARLGRRSRPRALIGGLGLGFTLRATLEHLPRNGKVVVAELFPEVVAWHRGPLRGLASGLDDPRVEVREADVAAVIAGAREAPFDAILLDVDNGPSALCVGSNRRLYGAEGILAVHSALAPAGVLGVWSTDPDRGFLRRLAAAGFDAEARTVRAHGGRGARHTVFLARRQ
ncbi:MAG: spermidine synthase [Thermoanaerobaculia bacterium]|nr:spermidine synthase [Thermoanaerobaculia bacterium]